MNHTLSRNVIWLTLIGLFLVGCVSQPAAPVSEISPPTQVPPTATHMPPTDTSALPTATQVPPTPTSAPPTVKPTETIAPTSTAAPSVFDPPSRIPSPRGHVSLAYDSESGQAMMFGGVTGNPDNPANNTGATWAYDVAANQWTQMMPPTGPRKGAVGMAYDIESDRVIIFGSDPEGADWRQTNCNETWAYDYNTNTWTRLADGPVKHLGARIAYDAESDRVILFGGYNVGGNYTYNDTWAYDFNSDTWTEMKPSSSPPGRNYQAMAYDDKADRVLVWGSADVDGPPHLSLWAYDFNTNTWQERLPSEPHPSGRESPVMVYDAESDRSIMFGGSSGGNETWAYDYNTNTWTNMKPSIGPGDRLAHGMAYSSAADRVILFGGQVEQDYSKETWTYDLNTNTWTKMLPNP